MRGATVAGRLTDRITSLTYTLRTDRIGHELELSAAMRLDGMLSVAELFPPTAPSRYLAVPRMA
jgi:hypothetical protein